MKEEKTIIKGSVYIDFEKPTSLDERMGWFREDHQTYLKNDLDLDMVEKEYEDKQKQVILGWTKKVEESLGITVGNPFITEWVDIYAYNETEEKVMCDEFPKKIPITLANSLRILGKMNLGNYMITVDEDESKFYAIIYGNWKDYVENLIQNM